MWGSSGRTLEEHEVLAFAHECGLTEDDLVDLKTKFGEFTLISILKWTTSNVIDLRRKEKTNGTATSN